MNLDDFDRCSRFESFKESWDHYGYGGDFEGMVLAEFSRIKGMTYLDHAGTTLFPESQIKGFFQDLCGSVYGNPHSHNPSSRLTHDTVEHVRYRILQHFNSSPEDYTVVFTAGCTAAIKLVAESFPWTPASSFCYLTDNHTSVVGIRGLTSPIGVASIPISPEEVEGRAGERTCPKVGNSQAPHLFCYPAQSNYSGKKYPLWHVKGIRSRELYPSCTREGQWFVLLDASNLVGCSPLDLQECPADFLPVSFYKMFGFPTGLGALIIRNECLDMLKKTYFGGGTAAAYLAGEDYYVPRFNIDGRFEDGTISFLDIIAVNHGFEALHRLTGGMERIQLHTFGLARHTYMMLSCLQHNNGQPVARLYCDTEYQDPSTQGPLLNFNLLDAHGDIVGYSKVQKLASLFNIQLRTGCFCNTGACQHYLGMSDQQVKANLQAGHVCGDDVDMIDGWPTGSVRVSFGYMSTFGDIQQLLRFVVDCFVQKPVRLDYIRLNRLHSASTCSAFVRHPQSPTRLQIPSPSGTGEGLEFSHMAVACSPTLRTSNCERTLSQIFIYPVKSCAAIEVTQWAVGPLGLLYDRLWMVVNINGVCLSQKQEPRLCLIQPSIHWACKELCLHATGMKPLSIPLEGNKQNPGVKVFQSKVCGDRVQSVDCGDEAADWISEFLGKPCRLIQQSPGFIRGMKRDHAKPVAGLSLVNEAQYLMINMASVKFLKEHINERQGPEAENLDIQQLIARFRANLVVMGAEPFEEDNWKHVVIGDLVFQVTDLCARCHMIGIDQQTATHMPEPLNSLSACRKGKVTFGVYLVRQHQLDLDHTSTLSVGCPVVPQSP
ncbi:molybdenum cofactor sulfurase-like isoform X1 [Paramormyrops kingsleyae]|uniref:Molybdenum cofactor sulfurase n=2 Tax=Paramormyrops kingsleyae TaxID=1676925 RepID=A0A3B3QAP9_9TELE|nr:molybdenum cofactor sulfurase isoform X1 [Paramormyrops kingsleyae]XP_023681579.1 molybdenum cofactor sulfurase isoform X1 [Paramormyrops kingsleyae]